MRHLRQYDSIFSPVSRQRTNNFFLHYIIKHSRHVRTDNMRINEWRWGGRSDLFDYYLSFWLWISFSAHMTAWHQSSHSKFLYFPLFRAGEPLQTSPWPKLTKKLATRQFKRYNDSQILRKFCERQEKNSRIVIWTLNEYTKLIYSNAFVQCTELLEKGTKTTKKKYKSLLQF